MAMLLKKFYEDHYEPLLLVDSNINTTRQYKKNIQRLTDFLKRPATLADITRDNSIQLAKILVDSGCSPATANKTISQLRALMNEAVRRGMAKVDRLPRLKEFQRVPTAWTPEQVSDIYAACRRLKGDIKGVPASLWWVAFHDVLLDTGIRAGAARRLEWGFIDWGRGLLMVPAEIQKNKKDQTFRLHSNTLQSLRDIQKPRRNLIFDYGKSYSIVWHYYHQILEDACLPNTRRDKFHRMRRTVATYLEKAGGNATELLGHASRDTTRRYLDEQMINRLSPCDVIDRPEAKGGAAHA